MRDSAFGHIEEGSGHTLGLEQSIDIRRRQNYGEVIRLIARNMEIAAAPVLFEKSGTAGRRQKVSKQLAHSASTRSAIVRTTSGSNSSDRGRLTEYRGTAEATSEHA